MHQSLTITNPNDTLTLADVPNFYSKADLYERELMQEASKVKDEDFDSWFNSLSDSMQVRFAIGSCMTRACKNGSESCRDFLKLVRNNLE